MSEKEMEFHPVTLLQGNVRFIPGPVARREETLKSWCQDNCDGGFKALPGGFTWLFDNALDAAAFEEKWNSRVKPEQEDGIEANG